MKQAQVHKTVHEYRESIEMAIMAQQTICGGINRYTGNLISQKVSFIVRAIRTQR